MMRKHYTPAFKAQIIQEVLKEQKTISAIASEHGIHPNQISAWKATVLSGMASLLTSEHQAATVAKEEHEREVQELYAEIGRLQTQLNWLKKKSGISVPS
jgi:transposase-like protein